jgi:hypothetical protein
MQLLWTDLAAIAIAGLLTLTTTATESSTWLAESRALGEAAAYLTSAPERAELVGAQWRVTDGSDTAWLDAQTGELVEIEFAAARP